MTASTMARMGRRIGRLAAVSAVALLLAGAAAAPAAAMDASEKVIRFKALCYGYGGDAFHVDMAGTWIVGCQLPEGDVWTRVYQ